MDEMRTITLTEDQLGKLEMVLRLTTRYRKDEEAACKALGQERDESGDLKYPNIRSNGEWWEEANKAMEEILTII